MTPHPHECTCAECHLEIACVEVSEEFADVLEVLVDEWGDALFGWRSELVERLVYACAVLDGPHDC